MTEHDTHIMLGISKDCLRQPANAQQKKEYACFGWYSCERCKKDLAISGEQNKFIKNSQDIEFKFICTGCVNNNDFRGEILDLGSTKH